MKHLKQVLRAMLAILAITTIGVIFNAPVVRAKDMPIRIGLVTFVSGPAAESFGVPARVAAEAIVESLNAGKGPSPYNAVGFGGWPLELVVIDEAGGTTKQVAEFRNLVETQQVDFVIGYISSDNCLAIAPVADELKKLTVLFDCGTPRVFEEGSYKYVFRTRAHATMDAVAGAHYLLEARPDLKSYAGINQDDAWGQDSWSTWTEVMRVLNRDAEITTSQMSKSGADQYGAEISALMQGAPEVIHSSLWGGDLEAFMLQSSARQLYQHSGLLLIAGEPDLHRLVGKVPDGTIVGARGPNGVFAPNSELNNWLRSIYKAKTGMEPNYPAYSAAQAFLGLKMAFEKARLEKIKSATPMGAAVGVKEGMEKAYAKPGNEEVAAAFEKLTFPAPSGKVMMRLGNGHQAVQGTAFGTTRRVGDEIVIENIKYYSVEQVQPPIGENSVDWIKGGLKPGRW